jgi:3-hydroxyisobutyrate dehydrogenase
VGPPPHSASARARTAPGGEQVGVVGLGGIGRGVAGGLVNAGHPVLVFDVSDDALRTRPQGTDPVASLPQLAAAVDVVFVAVWDDAQVRDVVTGADGLLAGERAPSAVVVLSTTTPATIRAVAGVAAERGVAVLDCGVAGGVRALAEQQIVAMVGGEDGPFERVRGLIGAFADPVVHVGDPGTGMAMKLARNLITYAERVVLWEAADLALGAGVGERPFLDVVRATDRWNAHTVLLDAGFMPPTASGGDPDFAARSASYAHKDLDAALRLADALELELPLTARAQRRYEVAVGRGPEPSEA